MPLQNNYNPNQQNNYNSNQQNNAQPGEKKNFNVTKFYCADGLLTVRMWKSDNNVLYTSLQIKQMIGKDPNGRTTFEGGLAKEIPSVLLRADAARTLYDLCKASRPEALNIKMPTGRDGREGEITITGANDGVTVTIKNSIGTRSTKFPATPVMDQNVHSMWNNFLLALDVCIRKSIFNRADDEILEASSDSIPF